MVQATSTSADALTSWRQRLREAVLPTVADASAWQTLLGRKDDMEALQQGIAADLPLAFSLLAEACRSPRIAANLSGLQHALRMFGSESLLAQLRRYPGERLDPAQPAHRRVLQALANSRLACLIQARWMLRDNAADADYRFWVTALLGVTRWKLPLIDPDLAAALDRRIAAGERRSRVEQSLLGLSLEQLNALHLGDLDFAAAADLQTRMRMPTPLLRAAARLAREEDRPLSAPPELARQLREPLWSCRLAYALALEAQADWHSRRTLLLLRIAAACLNRSVSGLRYDLERAALQASEEPLYVRGLLAPAARMIRIPVPRSRTRTLARVDASVATAPKPISAAASAAGAARPADFVARCVKRDFSAIGEFLNAAVRHLQDHDVGRCALLLKLRNPDRVGVYFTHGFSDAKGARAVHFQPQQAGLLKGLLSNPKAALLVSADQLPSLNGKLPPALEQWQPTGGLMLASVAVNNAAVGLWWAEPAAPRLADAQQLASLRQMMHGFGAEFTRLLRAQKTAQASTPRAAAPPS